MVTLTVLVTWSVQKSTHKGISRNGAGFQGERKTTTWLAHQSVSRMAKPFFVSMFSLGYEWLEPGTCQYVENVY